ncbi:hypothetical protein TRIUR3_07225 [Triticum urartu]|uniref:Uncharacterized protein n=1 Tax=Triticum urartu TaxID=4572 RepID=M8A9B8_TRIUA|nr:hypothetical protein TRIUR3_07225 [Triticum urartu]
MASASNTLPLLLFVGVLAVALAVAVDAHHPAPGGDDDDRQLMVINQTFLALTSE